MEISNPSYAAHGTASADDLLAQYGTELYRFCVSLTYTRPDAEDLFQETFLHALYREKRGKPLTDAKSGLFGLAVSLWKSEKRKYARRQRIAPTAPLHDEIPAGDSLEQAAEDRLTAARLRQCVAALPDKYRIPTLLYYGGDMPLADIAAALKIPVGTVKSRLHKARRLIETQWEE